jgi:hypothetical protein
LWSFLRDKLRDWLHFGNSGRWNQRDDEPSKLNFLLIFDPNGFGSFFDATAEGFDSPRSADAVEQEIFTETQETVNMDNRSEVTQCFYLIFVYLQINFTYHRENNRA